jgi:uncharacterized membrane protein YeaQ/YmgE (transglycosylase-associated protein family)
LRGRETREGAPLIGNAHPCAGGKRAKENHMDTIMLVVVGLIVGLAGSQIVPWNRDNNVGSSIVLGILGAFGGAMLGRAMRYSTHDPATFVASVLGAVAIVATHIGIRTRRTA